MDALAALVTLLRPQAIGVKIIHGSGRWGVRYPAFGQPSYALVLQGPCWLMADGFPAMILETGDFILFPAMPGFTLASHARVRPALVRPATPDQLVEEIFHGDAAAGPAVTLLGGYFVFDPLNAPLLLDLLPRRLHLRAAETAGGSIGAIVGLLQREARAQLDGRSLVLTRLIEIMLVETLRSIPPGADSAGLLAGLRDRQLAAALRAIHTRTAHPWTLATLAREAGMSRSSFAERFARVIATSPLNYLLQWRIAVAKDLLARGQKSVAETALAVGYESASGFSTAFSRETGQPPKEFMGLRQDVP